MSKCKYFFRMPGYGGPADNQVRENYSYVHCIGRNFHQVTIKILIRKVADIYRV